tara:strand:- start:564 stop:1028 length:465 start_codon:yes stop_codon:yes gene_type:complete
LINLISVINKIKYQNLTLSVAESCTGGKIASSIVSHEGVSEFFLGGVVSYSVDSKIRILNIGKEKIEKCGAVSSEIAKEMSIGVKNKFESDISVAVTGNVGSKSGDGKSAVGKVFIAINFNDKIDTWEFNFNSDRKTNIESAVSNVFSLLNNIL